MNHISGQFVKTVNPHLDMQYATIVPGNMDNSITQKKRTVKGETRWFIPFLYLLLIIAITVSILYFYQKYPDKIAQIKTYGYLGVFIISLTLNATVILPAGNILIISALGAVLPSATIAGLVGGTGAAIGETTGYMAGYSGRKIIERNRLYNKIEGWMQKWGSLTIFLLSAAPLIFDVAGLAAGALRFPFWKFLLFCWLGRTILYIGVAWAGTLGWDVVLHYLG